MKATGKFDVLVVGELNIDLILNNLQSLPEVGKEILAGQMTYTLGSSSAIFANNLSSLGAKTSFLGKVGKDSFGRFIINHLKNAGISTRYIKEEEKLSTGITTIYNVGEDRAMITYPGAMEYLSGSDISDRHLNTARHLHVSSVFLQPALKPDLVNLFRRAKQAGLTTSLDPQWDPKEEWSLPLEELLPLTDVFLPNEAEFLNLTQASTCAGGIEAVKDFCNIIAVKCGNKGAVLFDKNESYELSSYKNEHVVDAIGAGDSFDAGFIYQFLKGTAYTECADFANLAGAISTTSAGGTGAIKNADQVIELGKQEFGYQSKLR